ncbi:hypothetical protein IFM89_014763 [Coptis chinensis]|uniref:Uncharacterized protein n=1 Tax=Coptis chinensis TaxID=261450 RepID=A0A835IN95_9MAGN|nr:hypothetical protein IFM89_014763 [Coptis chinensis]
MRLPKGNEEDSDYGILEMEAEPHDPCHVGDVGGQETHRLLHLCICCPPGPSGDLNDQYHSSKTAAFGEPFAGLPSIRASELAVSLEPFAGLPCIKASEPKKFDLNQDVTVGSSSLQCSQTSHLDLNQVNHVGGPSDSWHLPSQDGSSSTSLEVVKSAISRFRSSGSLEWIEVTLQSPPFLQAQCGLKGNPNLSTSGGQLDIDPPWRFTPMFFEIQSIMSRLVLGRISHIHREGNSLAHKLANENLTKDFLTVWDQMPNL